MDSPPLSVYIRGLDGDLHLYHVSPKDTVLSLKVRFAEAAGIEIDTLRFIFTEQMNDEHALSHYSLRNGSTITPIIRKIRTRTLKNIQSEQNDPYQ